MTPDSSVAAHSYPVPFYLRPLGPLRPSYRQAVLLWVMLMVIGGVSSLWLSVHQFFSSWLLFLLLYSTVVSFGYWALTYAYNRTKDTLVRNNLAEHLLPCLRQIYSPKQILATSLALALFIVLVQFALRFNVPPSITVYLIAWNFLAGFVSGLGLWTAYGSLRLARACAESPLDILPFSPLDTPALLELSKLMWTHTFLFTSEVLIFSSAVNWASVTMREYVARIHGPFSGLDLAGAIAFFLIFVFAPWYAFMLQWRLYSPVRRSREKMLVMIEMRIRRLLEAGESVEESHLWGLVAAASAVRGAHVIPVDTGSIAKLVSILVPGLSYLYAQNPQLILRLLHSVKSAFWPGL